MTSLDRNYFFFSLYARIRTFSSCRIFVVKYELYAELEFEISSLFFLQDWPQYNDEYKNMKYSAVFLRSFIRQSILLR